MPLHTFDWNYGWHVAGMWVIGILLLVGILALVRWLVSSTPPTAPSRDSAEETLRIRYARGDIDHEEFDRRLTKLRRPH
jgi:putative membrane protein